MKRLRKPIWWKGTARSFWLLSILLLCIAYLILFGVLVASGLVETERFLAYTLVTVFFTASAYYIRTIPSLSLWRAIWIVAGAGIFGFPLFVTLLLVLGKTLVPIIDAGISVIVTLATSVVIGALIGDRLGKRRNYKPLS